MKRAQVIVAVVLAAAVMATSVILGACGGGGGNSAPAAPTPKIQLSGTISSTGYTLAAKPSSLFFAKALSFLGYPTNAYAAGGPSIHKIIALPIGGGSLTMRQMSNAQSAAITTADGGKFSLSLAKDTDWVLVMVDSSNQFVGSVAVDAGSSNSLLSVPATASALTSLSLGTINNSTANDGLSTYVVSTTDFSALNPAQLTAMAKTDDIFRNAKNIINNYNVSTGIYYQLRPDFSWKGDFSTLSATYSNPTLTFNGMNFQLDTNSPTITMTQLCSIGTVTVGLFPSVSISDGVNTYDASNPVSNSGATGCSPVNGFQQLNGGNIYATDAYADGGAGLSYSVMPVFTTVPLPVATWTWKEMVSSVTTIKAVFDVATINPPVNPDGTPKGFVPSFKINLVPSTTQIASVDIKWYYYNGATYTAVAPADLAVLKHFVSSMEVKFDVTYPSVGGARTTCEMYFDPVTTSNVIPANFVSRSSGCAATWYYNDAGHPATNTGLMGFYESGGFGYFFHFFTP